MSLTKKSIRSVGWSAIERISVQAIQLIVSITLARMVAPSEYGLIAMLTIFIAIAQAFTDSGFASALIQKNERTEKDFNTVFYFNVVASLLLYLVLFFSAPYISMFYGEQSLELLCKWLGLGIIIQGLSIVQVAKLTIALDFKTQAKASLMATIVSGCVGVGLANNGYGVWALLVQSLLGNLINTVSLWLGVRWLPKLIFSWDSLKSLLSFGSKLLISGLLHTVYVNLYSLAIGRKYSASDVGYYNQASLYARFPSVSLMAVISRAIYPIQCESQNDAELLKSSFIKYLRMSCYIIFPIMTCIAILADPLVCILLTEKWLPASNMLSILCLAYMLNPMMVMNSQMLNVVGRPDLFLKSEIIKKICGVFILFCTIPFGLNAICIGILLYNICDTTIIIYFSREIVSAGYKTQLKEVCPIFGISIVSGLCVYVLLHLISDNLLKICIGISAGIAFYVFLSSALKLKEYGFLIRESKKLIYK